MNLKCFYNKRQTARYYSVNPIGIKSSNNFSRMLQIADNSIDGKININLYKYKVIKF